MNWLSLTIYDMMTIGGLSDLHFNRNKYVELYNDDERYHPLVYAYRRGALRRAYFWMGHRVVRPLDYWNSDQWDWFITHLGYDHFFSLFDSLNDLISLMLVNKHTNQFLKQYYSSKLKLEDLTYQIYPFATLQPRFNKITYEFPSKPKSSFIHAWQAKEPENPIKPMFMNNFPSQVRKYQDPLNKYVVGAGHRRAFKLHTEKEQKKMIKRFYADGLHDRMPKVYGGKRNKNGVSCRSGNRSIERNTYCKPRMTYYRDKNLSKHANYRKNKRREVKIRRNGY